MPIARIPERYRSGFALLLSFEEHKVSELVEAVRRTPPNSDFQQFVEAVHGQLKGWKTEEVYNVVRSLYSLCTFLADEETAVDEIISQAIEAMRSSGKEDLFVAPESQGRVAAHLKTLLTIESLRLASKALGLKTDHERLFCGVKIVTDIRPVFSDVQQKPTRAIIGHTLKLEYHEEGEHKELYLALDADDIRKIGKVLQRAETKETSLRALLGDAGLSEFDQNLS
jgi:hypothetical protein